MNKKVCEETTKTARTDGAFDCPLIDLLLQGRFLLTEKCDNFVNVNYYKARDLM